MAVRVSCCHVGDREGRRGRGPLQVSPGSGQILDGLDLAGLLLMCWKGPRLGVDASTSL